MAAAHSHVKQLGDPALAARDDAGDRRRAHHLEVQQGLAVTHAAWVQDRARTALSRAELLQQLEQGMAGPTWQPEDWEWRPTWTPNASRRAAASSNSTGGQMKQLLRQLTRSLADLEAPQHGLRMLQDGALLSFYSSSLAAATAARPEATVLVLANGGGGLLALLAAAAGARRVVVVERSRWGCRVAKQLVERNAASHAELVGRIEVVLGRLSSCRYGAPQGSASDANGTADQYRLAGQADVVVTELFDYSVLGQGLLPALHEAVALNLLAPDVLMVPQRLRVWGQLVSTALTEPVAGFDLSAMDRYLWHPTIERIEHARCSQLKPASGPVVLTELDLSSSAAAADEPSVSSSTSLSSGCAADALLVWFELDSGHGHVLSTAPAQQLTAAEASSTPGDSSSSAAASGLGSTMRHTGRYGAGLAYLGHALTARPSTTAVTLVAHRSPSSTRLHFEATADAAKTTWSPLGLPRHAWVPRWQFDMLADGSRNDSYDAAIRRAVSGIKAKTQAPVHVLDLGTGTGLLAMMAVR